MLARGGVLVGAATENVLGHVAVETKQLEPITREVMRSQPSVESLTIATARILRRQLAAMLAAVAVNVVNAKERWRRLAATTTVTAIGNKNALSQCKVDRQFFLAKALMASGLVIASSSLFRPEYVEAGESHDRPTTAAPPLTRGYRQLEIRSSRASFVAAAPRDCVGGCTGFTGTTADGTNDITTTPRTPRCSSWRIAVWLSALTFGTPPRILPRPITWAAVRGQAVLLASAREFTARLVSLAVRTPSRSIRSWRAVSWHITTLSRELAYA